jgi:hypothetical protein
MPFHLEKFGLNKYYVVTTDTGNKHSKNPITKEKAEAQLRILQHIYQIKEK